MSITVCHGDPALSQLQPETRELWKTWHFLVQLKCNVIFLYVQLAKVSSTEPNEDQCEIRVFFCLVLLLICVSITWRSKGSGKSLSLLWMVLSLPELLRLVNTNSLLDYIFDSTTQLVMKTMQSYRLAHHMKCVTRLIWEAGIAVNQKVTAKITTKVTLQIRVVKLLTVLLYSVKVEICVYGTSSQI